MIHFSERTLTVRGFVIWSAIVALTIANQQDAEGTCDNSADCARSRHRRATCSGSVYTMSHFIEIVEKLEQYGNDSPQDYARYLRKHIYAKGSFSAQKQWDYACGQAFSGSMSAKALTKREQADLTMMIVHGAGPATSEKGVVQDRHGTVATGHVITGLSCGGFNRDTELTMSEWYIGTSSNMDNLFFVTISGDMGQTALMYYSHNSSAHRLFGPGGQWNNATCPTVYTVSMPDSELSDAEVKGDMDGAILGTIMPMIKSRNWKISRIFREYYQNSGITVGGRTFSAANRVDTFGELMSDVELLAQSEAFAQVYYEFHKGLYNGKKLPALLARFPDAIEKFYKDYVPCTTVLKSKHTIDYFVGLVKKMESEKNLGVVEMTQAIVGVSPYFKSDHLVIMLDVDSNGREYTDHFGWFVLRELVTHDFAPRDQRRELGVIEAGGDVVAIGHVLAGIHASTDSKTRLYGATVAGSLALAAVKRDAANAGTSNMMGATGAWDRTMCPYKYRLKRSIKPGQHTTRAELLGAIDGFVLGRHMADWLSADPSLKLSTVLERYYGTSFNSVSSQVRFDQLKTHMDKAKLVKETTKACEQMLWFDSFCKAAAVSAVNEFYKTMLPAKGRSGSSYNSKLLPDYRTLVAAFPAGISAADLLKKLAGGRQIDSRDAAVNTLRISYMLNKLFGHLIPQTQSQGSVIHDNTVYIYDTAILKSYLTGKYGAPDVVTTVSKLNGKTGIVVFDTAALSDGSMYSVGLWDGSKMYGVTDVSKQANVVKKASLWKTNGCSSQADAGNCDFYKCMNWAVPCGTSGYALGYGERYCGKFYSSYDKFNADGKKWVDDLRACIMKAVAPFHKGAHTCEAIKRKAFASHVDCYENSQYFCKMAESSSNRVAAFDIFDPNGVWDFWGHAAWTQFLDTLEYCQKNISKSGMGTIKTFTKEARAMTQQSLSSKQPNEAGKLASVPIANSATCVGYANAGDCRFYKCFQDKFPCEVFDVSHVMDFEFPLCEDLNSQNLYMDLQGKQWLTKTNKCLMQKLLPLYNDVSTTCVDLHLVMFQDRIDCLVDSGFCQVTASTKNRFAIDYGTHLWSYPSLLPAKTELTVIGRNYFYSELSSLRRLMGYANYACFKKELKKHESLYARVLTPSGGYRLVEQN